MRRRLVLVAAAVVVLLGLATAGYLVLRDDPVVIDGPVTDEQELLTQLREGGLVIYQRHTETTRMGVDPPDTLASCDLQRELSDAGRQDAVEIGEAFEQLGIPVGRVVSSPFCRVEETARLAFSRYGEVEITDALLSRATARRGEPGMEERIAAEARDLIGTAPAAGTNTVLVGSVSNVQDVTGVAMDEGGAAVFRPTGDGEFVLVALVRPQGWQDLADRTV
jgi:hypothetical protein